MTTDGLFTPTRVLQHVNTPEVKHLSKPWAAKAAGWGQYVGSTGRIKPHLDHESVRSWVMENVVGCEDAP